MDFISIDDEMTRVAKEESARRNPYIKHHFDPQRLSREERDMVGFLGEFACCKLFGIDWKDNIRDNYFTIDNFDLVYNGKRIDVKTETIPQYHALKVLNRTINDNALYSRRLVNEKQLPLLHKYDAVIFGLFMTGDYNKWYPIGYLEALIIMANYQPQKNRPDGGVYQDPAVAIPTPDIKPISALFKENSA